jgi:hypothetical protein
LGVIEKHKRWVEKQLWKRVDIKERIEGYGVSLDVLCGRYKVIISVS